MSFISLSFLAFLGVLLLLYYLLPKRAQWALLLIGSYVFYAFAGLPCLAFLVFTTAVAYVTGRLLARSQAREDAYIASVRDEISKEERKAYRAKGKGQRRLILAAGLVLGFGLLAVFKYTGFTVRNLNAVIHLFDRNTSIPVPSLLLPLGLSFYVFQTMGYLIDVYRGKAGAEKNPFRLALFVSFFPQLVQGPISRYSELAKQLYTPHRADWGMISGGLLRVAWGYFKKLVVADTVLIAIRTLLSDTAAYEGAYVLLLILLYSIEIYGDFTGGIDITIGTAQMFGIRLTENFDRPFSSESTKEYWRRWHITMGTWFTDYIFYPLSVSKPMQKLSKWSRAHLGQAVGKRLPVYIATIVTWFLTGLWHGADWNFIVWGLLNCLIILVSQELEPLWRRFRENFPRLDKSAFFHGFRAVRTFLLMGLIRSLDCYRDVPKTFSLWVTMFTRPDTYRTLFGGGLLALGLTVPDFILIGLSVLLIFFVSRAGREKRLSEPDRLPAKPVLLCLCVCALVIAALVFGNYGQGYDASDFIYGQF